MKQLTARRQPLHHDPSAFCRVILTQAGIERDRSGLVENTVHAFDIRKFRKFKREFLVECNANQVSPPPLNNEIFNQLYRDSRSWLSSIECLQSPSLR